ncbi:MAG: hypothetical protein AB7G62_17915 [Magnetospirillum sp.]
MKTTPSHIDLETAARRAGVTRRTIQNKLSSGEIPPQAVRMVGRRKLVSVAALNAAFGQLFTDSLPLPGNFQDVAELRAKLAAQETIIADLRATLDHERHDRTQEREQWRKSLERTQATLLAAHDTPAARALAGASGHGLPRPWWRRLLP